MSFKNHATYRFGGFHIDGRERLLKRGGVPVSIGPKVLDALLLLLENAGKLVERSTLKERLWPGQIVEEGTVARVIADLRKVLRDVGDERRYIETIPKFGYRFVADIEEDVIASPGSTDDPEPIPPAPPLPAPAEMENLTLRPWSSRKWVAGSAAGLVLLAGAVFAVERLRTQPPPVQSLLITPFQIIGEAPDAAMIQFGLQDSLTMELSGLSALAVMELNSNGAAPTEDVAETGRRHHAGFVLAGTIQIASGRIRVNARMLRCATGQAVWTRRFDESLDEVFKVESRLAKLTVAELIPALPASEGERLERRLPSNAAAYRYYLLGRHYWNKREENAYVQAIEMFKKAAEADPDYAPAYVGLADSYLLDPGSRSNPLAQALPPARAAVEKAIQLDPSLGAAHATLAMIAGSYYFDWDKAERELQTAIRLSPNYVTAHHWYAEFLTMMGKFDLSEAEFEVARNLDPASPIILTDIAQLYCFQKQYERSLQTLDEVLKLDPSFHLAHDRKGYALMLMRRPEEAFREFEAGDQQAGRQGSTSERAWAEAVRGKRQEAIALMQQAEREDPNPFILSVVWAELGDSDRAMDWLQKAYDGRTSGLVSLKVNPVFDRLRPNPRFQALLRKMNLN